MPRKRNSALVSDVSGREVVEMLEARGCVFAECEEHGFKIIAPKGFEDGKLVELMQQHADDVGKYLHARDEHVSRLVVLPVHSNKQ